ncbi:MAG: hypothetical protein JNK72_08440 [Myxococcales bacterium]|nr:hypothetical protein [Myxococcales bacterium]
MQRMKMALGIVVGAVLLQLAFMACSGNTPGIMGGSDAAAQTTPACTQWEITTGPTFSPTLPRTAQVEPGWEPFAFDGVAILRRCIAR